MDLDVLSNSHKLRAAILTWISITLGFIASGFAVYNYAVGTGWFLVISEALFAVYSFWLYSAAKKRTHNYLSIILFVAFLAVIVLGGTLNRPLESGLFIWTCFFPIFFYLLLGKKNGLLATGFMAIIQIAVVLYKIQLGTSFIGTPLILNLLFCYLSIWVVSHIFESNRKKAEVSLGVLASKDVLTNTYNRLALTYQFPVLQRKESAPLCLLILDIDFFKQVNDQFGHSVGDKVLIETALLLQKFVGESQVFRIGGEEFCITLQHTDLKQAEAVAEAIRHEVSVNQFHHGSQAINLTVSIGVCACDGITELEDVLLKADSELYRAKQNGRNQVMVCASQLSKPLKEQTQSAQ
ncbi:diguanylate cyclase [Vibrio paucivorans]|uniref:diguanylate cyclase n=1 Tax=Vibrio paucivorans TaxID=2829489 RepID=A0A9X3HP91_9VIBR|nr:diguanylate cyclase [Vibrio paucivorans]MCW8332529.1 diguanylate cyclase [Vibrio paucivorans]